MRAALGPLNWTPATFWKATPHEFVAACEGPKAIEAKERMLAIQALGKKVQDGYDSRRSGS